MNKQDKMKQLSELISSMNIEDVMYTVNTDSRVLLLNWFYANHIAEMWNTTTDVIEPQMYDIKDMFQKIVCSGCINTTENIEEQIDYLDEWGITLSDNQDEE